MLLFGSYARGTATSESDIDDRVDKGELRGLVSLSGLQQELSEAFEKKIDLLTTNSLSKEFLNQIGEYEICIYERKQPCSPKWRSFFERRGSWQYRP